MTRPENELERRACDEWRHGDPVKAMQALRGAGYDERARERFLTAAGGVRDLGDLRLHRDSYLDWRDEADRESSRDRERQQTRQWVRQAARRRSGRPR